MQVTDMVGKPRSGTIRVLLVFRHCIMGARTKIEYELGHEFCSVAGWNMEDPTLSMLGSDEAAHQENVVSWHLFALIFVSLFHCNKTGLVAARARSFVRRRCAAQPISFEKLAAIPRGELVHKCSHVRSSSESHSDHT